MIPIGTIPKMLIKNAGKPMKPMDLCLILRKKASYDKNGVIFE